MNINVQINLGNGEYAGDLSGNATEIAESILTAVGGDPEKDTVNVTLNDMGSAGVSSMPQPPPVINPLKAEEPAPAAKTTKKG